jgi:mono/diheme cytochrome c family protein
MKRSDPRRTLAYVGSLLLFLAAGVLAADTAEDWTAPPRAARRKNPIAADAASIAAGKTLYAQQCLSCHGDKGKGDGTAAKDLEKKPGDLSSAKVQEQSDGSMFWKITEGRKPMPTFEKLLTEDQRWQVINYVRTLSAAPTTQKSE